MLMCKTFVDYLCLQDWVGVNVFIWFIFSYCIVSDHYSDQCWKTEILMGSWTFKRHRIYVCRIVCTIEENCVLWLRSFTDPGGFGSERWAAGADVQPDKLQHRSRPGGAAAQVRLNVCGETWTHQPSHHQLQKGTGNDPFPMSRKM